MTAVVAERRDDAWARLGWVMGAVWLFFWIFPLTYVWSSDLDLTFQLSATGLILTFCAVYIQTLRTTNVHVVTEDYLRARRTGVAGLVALIAIGLVLAWMLGPNSMTAGPFIVSLPVFFLPWRQMWVVCLGLLAAIFVGSAIAWTWWPNLLLWAICLAVLSLSVVSRYVDEKQDAQRTTEARVALTEQREQVARDVHDVLGHSLTVVAMKTELAKRLVDTDPERAKHELAEVQDLSRQALAEIRATVGGLRVARLTEEVEAARMACAGAGIDVTFPEDLSVVDPRHRITMAWVLREAVTNVVRHSRARRCVVELGSDCITVTDDGRGLQGRREGNGLGGLRERVQQAGGRLYLGAGPDGHGTRLEVRL
ncbi:sensor histidine kinase [Ornithinimicrobium cerasi]|uniref:sensor histidine kinase n=1 Tax=Ornithinimicrobium cerasi TaxID=2248773 RepID=UPI00192A1936|nr:sensor histidine kinase [Ornithinimicrobium cerasi]